MATVRYARTLDLVPQEESSRCNSVPKTWLARLGWHYPEKYPNRKSTIDTCAPWSIRRLSG